MLLLFDPLSRLVIFSTMAFVKFDSSAGCTDAGSASASTIAMHIASGTGPS
jgi:hypothetical protein